MKSSIIMNKMFVNKYAANMKKIISVVVFISFLICLGSMIPEPTIKTLKGVKEFQIPICQTKNIQCLGYSHVDVGLDGIVNGIYVKDHFAYILDGRFNNIAKLDLRNGLIVDKSASIMNPKEAYPCVKDFFSYEDNLYFLSDCTGDIFMIDTSLNITSIYQLPHGRPMRIIHVENKPYIFQSGRGRTTDSILVTGIILQPDLSVSHKEMMIHRDLYWTDTLVFGHKVSMRTNDTKPYLQTHIASYKLPEIIPDFDYFYRNIGYNEMYLVYTERKKDYYRVVVCSY
jgi:hypothetical protein